ncbi:hypothetical protein [Sorangium sp. So ce861]|uniref:hypothetical protein n=1 Tax=Sorangium sp. So ce861 TaxID=3133323 RepID=UPI003F61EE56
MPSMTAAASVALPAPTRKRWRPANLFVLPPWDFASIPPVLAVVLGLVARARRGRRAA